jgi:hypothetical protein
MYTGTWSRVYLKQVFKLTTVAALLVLTGSILNGQSGRRVKRPSTVTPVPSSVVTAPETSQESKAEEKPDPSKIAIVVTSHNESGIIPMDRARSIVSSFTQRLRDNKSTAVTEGKARTYGDAQTQAEANKSAYFVWLNLQPDTYDSSSPNRGAINYDDIVVQYTVFSPVTGRVKTQGRVYYQRAQSQRTRTLGIPGTSNGRNYPTQSPRMPVEYTLERAGREAADRVLEALKDVVPES